MDLLENVKKAPSIKREQVSGGEPKEENVRRIPYKGSIAYLSFSYNCSVRWPI